MKHELCNERTTDEGGAEHSCRRQEGHDSPHSCLQFFPAGGHDKACEYQWKVTKAKKG